MPRMPADVPNVVGGYLEKGAKAVIDMQDELRNQALKLFSGFPYSAAGNESAAAQEKARPKAAKPRKGHSKK
jgi:polyhydroxyalkanoate synthesis regulator protein